MDGSCARAVELGCRRSLFTEHLDHTVWRIALRQRPPARPPLEVGTRLPLHDEVRQVGVAGSPRSPPGLCSLPDQGTFADASIEQTRPALHTHGQLRERGGTSFPLGCRCRR
jgi:hypothetical protein